MHNVFLFFYFYSGARCGGDVLHGVGAAQINWARRECAAAHFIFQPAKIQFHEFIRGCLSTLIRGNFFFHFLVVVIVCGNIRCGLVYTSLLCKKLNYYFTKTLLLFQCWYFFVFNLILIFKKLLFVRFCLTANCTGDKLRCLQQTFNNYYSLKYLSLLFNYSIFCKEVWFLLFDCLHGLDWIYYRVL